MIISFEFYLRENAGFFARVSILPMIFEIFSFNY